MLTKNKYNKKYHFTFASSESLNIEKKIIPLSIDFSH